MPSSITTFVIVAIFNRLLITTIVSRAAFSSMQGTKNEVPRRNLDQSIWYVTVSIFIFSYEGVHL